MRRSLNRAPPRAGTSRLRYQLDRQGKPAQPFAAWKKLEAGGRVVVMGRAWPASSWTPRKLGVALQLNRDGRARPCITYAPEKPRSARTSAGAPVEKHDDYLYGDPRD